MNMPGEKENRIFPSTISDQGDIQQEYPPIQKEKSNFPRGKKQPPPSLRGA